MRADYSKLAQFEDDGATGVDYAKLAKFEEPRSLSDRALSAIPRTADLNAEQALAPSLETLKSGYENINKEGINKVIGTGQLALGGLGYVLSPIAAAAKTFVGDPVRRSLGGLTDVGC